MENNITTYKARRSNMIGGVILITFSFFAFILPDILDRNMETHKWVGSIAFILIGVVLTILPLGAQLEVGEDCITTWFFGVRTTRKIHASDIQVIVYDNIFRGGLGYGKGIIFRALIDGKSRAYNIAEAIYGKDAVAHARRVLSNKGKIIN